MKKKVSRILIISSLVLVVTLGIVGFSESLEFQPLYIDDDDGELGLINSEIQLYIDGDDGELGVINPYIQLNIDDDAGELGITNPSTNKYL